MWCWGEVRQRNGDWTMSLEPGPPIQQAELWPPKGAEDLGVPAEAYFWER